MDLVLRRNPRSDVTLETLTRPLMSFGDKNFSLLNLNTP
jgi:hypothetical protein